MVEIDTLVFQTKTAKKTYRTLWRRTYLYSLHIAYIREYPRRGEKSVAPYDASKTNKPPGGHLGIFWVGMCRPVLQIGTPF